MTNVFGTFSDIRRHSAQDSIRAGMHAFGRGLLRIPASLERWARTQEMQRQLAALDLRLLDDIGLTRADRDAMLR